ncbi:MAG: class A beta-lactamase [Actinobacteria bacterium]|nr:class A beta-lactamase [Actinomycetota bacterium]
MSFSPSRAILRAAPFLLLPALLSACSGSSGAPARTASPTASAPAPAAAAQARTAQALAQLERRFSARLGVYVLDTGTGRAVAYRADERFAFCSTAKALSAGLLLRRDTGAQLDQDVHYTATDLVDYSPITSRHTGTGMRLRDIMAAALQYSDNTAANLMLDQLGGPQQVQTALRGLHDTTTDVDRTEPTLNDATPGDIRDTSTPRALGTDLRQFLLGNALTVSRRQLLTNWLLGNTTGGRYIRAGVPAGWKVADKTGNGDWGTRNDIAVAWPPSGAPFVIAVLSHRGSANAPSEDALIADATKTAISALHQ